MTPFYKVYRNIDEKDEYLILLCVHFSDTTKSAQRLIVDDSLKPSDVKKLAEQQLNNFIEHLKETQCAS